MTQNMYRIQKDYRTCRNFPSVYHIQKDVRSRTFCGFHGFSLNRKCFLANYDLVNQQYMSATMLQQVLLLIAIFHSKSKSFPIHNDLCGFYSAPLIHKINPLNRPYPLSFFVTCFNYVVFIVQLSISM